LCSALWHLFYWCLNQLLTFKQVWLHPLWSAPGFGVKKWGSGVQHTKVWIFSLSVASSATLDKLPNFSELKCLHMKERVNYPYLLGLFEGRIEIIYVNYPSHIRCSINPSFLSLARLHFLFTLLHVLIMVPHKQMINTHLLIWF
jgi:hypothetical protein